MLGTPLSDWKPPPRPGPEALTGRHVRLERLEADRHAFELHAAFHGHDGLWDYMFNGPYSSASAYHRWAREHEVAGDQVFYAFRDMASGLCGGLGSYLRIAPEMGTIEVGSITIAPSLQRGTAWTEAMVLMMGWAFAAGYRRYEWKCDALNLPSRRAAERLGFSFEGMFRQHMIVKGRNRDTAWFSIIDTEWPALAEAYAVWLSPRNFDRAGRQRERLSDLTRLVRASSDPALNPRRG